MDKQFIYQRERRRFGQQTNFSDKNNLIFTEATNPDLFKFYREKNPVDRSTQYGKEMSLTEVNTQRAVYKSCGVFHTEGGWPKDINTQDPEQTVRYKRKIEKDESYINQIMNLSKQMEHYIFQNNAINVYENYFEGLDSAPLADPCKSRTVNVYHDRSPFPVPITHLSWSPDCGVRLAVSHCDITFQGNKFEQSVNSYIWEIENPNQPLFILKPKVPCVCIEYNQKDPSSLVSGMKSGQVSIWDTRHSQIPVIISEREISHRELVTSILWINSKSGTEFFSGSSDGQIFWWDTRKLQEPLDKLYMDPVKTDDQNLNRSYGISALEYETTIPTRFMCATEMGMVFLCNRKGKTPIEKIQTRIMCHLGPVYAITRNPAFVKNFLTIGDWSARIWSEDCRENPIIWTKNQKVMLTDGSWSNTKYSISFSNQAEFYVFINHRVSLFFISRMDGVLDAWDLLQQQNEPVLRMKVCDEPLYCLRTHETGKYISCGSKKGTAYLIGVSDNMTYSSKNDKPFLTAMFERESKREKILEAKSREIKLKVKTANNNPEAAAALTKPTNIDFDDICKQFEVEFQSAVNNEKEKRKCATSQ